jgi:hypothetical protein
MEQKLIYDLHTEHVEWLNKLAFYKDDLKVLKHRLSEIAIKNTDKEVLANVEHFENQLIVQNEQNDILRHDVKQYENMIQQSIAKNPTATDHRKMPDHDVLRDAVETNEKIFTELRKDLINFFVKWM